MSSTTFQVPVSFSETTLSRILNVLRIVTLLIMALFLAMSADNGMWFDEAGVAVSVIDASLWDTLVVANHETIYTALTSMSITALGDDDSVYRIWSMIPLFLSALLFGRWAAARVSAAAGLLVTVLIGFSPMVLYWSIQARAYGFIILASVLMIMGASAIADADERGGWKGYALLFTGGALGYLNFPQTLAAFGSLMAVLFILRSHARKPLLVTGFVSAIVFFLLYRPSVLVGRVTVEAVGHPGNSVGWFDMVVGVWRYLVVGTLTGTGELAQLIPAAGLRSIVLAILLALTLCGIWQRWSAGGVVGVLIPCLPIVATFALLAVGGLAITDRNVLFLFPFWAFLVACGGAWLVGKAVSMVLARPAIALAFGLITVFGGLQVLQLGAYWEQVPIEAYAEASLAASSATDQPIYLDSARPEGFVRYLDYDYTHMTTPELQELTCEEPTSFVVIDHPLHREVELDLQCLHDRGAVSTFFPQRRRGTGMSVWFVPPLETPAADSG